MLQFNFARHSFQWKRTNFYGKFVAKSKILWRNDFVSPNLFHYSQNSQDSASEKEYTPISSGKWEQTRFYLGSCLGPVTYEGLSTYKEAGFNLSQWGLRGDTYFFEGVKNSNKIGGLYSVMFNEFRFMQAGTAKGELAFNENSVRNAIYEFAAVDPNDTIVGYAVWDEPSITDRYVSEATKMMEYINKYDPNSVRFINLLPSYGIYTWDSDKVDGTFGESGYEAYVEEHIQKVNPDTVGLDYYPYLMGQEGYTADWFRDMGLYRKMSLKYNKPIWYYYQIVQISGAGKKPTNDDIRYQMYVGLAYGAKQLSEWVAIRDGLDHDGNKTEKFEEVKARNAELMTVGSYLSDKTSVAIYQTKDSFYSNPFKDTAKF